MQISQNITENYKINNNYSEPTKFNTKIIILTLTAAYLLVFWQLVNIPEERITLIISSFLYAGALAVCFLVYVKYNNMYFARYLAVLSVLPAIFINYLFANNVFSLFLIIINISLYIYSDKKFGQIINSILIAGTILFTFIKFINVNISFEVAILHLLTTIAALLVCRKVNDFQLIFDFMTASQIDNENQKQNDTTNKLDSFTSEISLNINALYDSSDNLKENLTACENLLNNIIKNLSNFSSSFEENLLKNISADPADKFSSLERAENFINIACENSAADENSKINLYENYRDISRVLNLHLQEIKTAVSEAENLNKIKLSLEKILENNIIYQNGNTENSNKNYDDVLKLLNYINTMSAKFKTLIDSFMTDVNELVLLTENIEKFNFPSFAEESSYDEIKTNLKKICTNISEIRLICDKINFSKRSLLDTSDDFSENINKSSESAEISMHKIKKNITSCNFIQDNLSELDYIFNEL